MEKFNKCSIILVLVFLFSSCGGNSNNDRFFVDSKTFNVKDLKTSRLEGSVMQFNDTIWNPVEITVKDTLLFLKNRSTKHVYEVYNLNNNEKINECFSLGQGPDDFIHPIFVQSAGNNVWLFDRGAASLKEFVVSDLLKYNTPKMINTISIKNKTASKVAVLSDGSILSPGITRSRGGFDLYNKEGLILDSIGKYPELISGTLSDMEKLMSFQHGFATNMKDRIFLSYAFSDLIEVYDFKGKCISRMHGPHQHDLVMGLRSSGEFTGAAPVRGKTYYCYGQPVYAGNEVFVLYYGELSETFEGLNNKIIVFDWNGKPLRMYELDIPLFTFTVDYDQRIIYGLTDAPEFRIIKFNY